MNNRQLAIKLDMLIEQYRDEQSGFYTAAVLREAKECIEKLEKMLHDCRKHYAHHVASRNQEYESIDWTERN